MFKRVTGVPFLLTTSFAVLSLNGACVSRNSILNPTCPSGEVFEDGACHPPSSATPLAIAQMLEATAGTCQHYESETCLTTSTIQVQTSGGDGGGQTYVWNIVGATLESGQGTDTITVSSESELSTTFDVECTVTDATGSDFANRTFAHNRTSLGIRYTIIPGLYGFGTETRGAYGGAVDPVILHVDTLAAGISNTDATHGSFAWALAEPYPRVVVFDVSGLIDSSDYVIVDSPNLWIAGQSAPGPIAFNGQGLTLSSHDIVLEHLAIRNQAIASRSGLVIQSYYDDTYNVVINHASISWATHAIVTVDESAPYVTGDITIANSIWAECLASHSIGAWIYAGRVALLGNIFAHISKASPGIGNTTEVAVYNNVYYDWAQELTEFEGCSDPVQAPSHTSRFSLIGNVGKAGPSTSTSYEGANHLVRMSLNAELTTNQLSMRDSILAGTAVPGVDIYLEYSWPYAVVPETALPGYTPDAATATYDAVLSKAGARPASRDAADARIISEIQSGTGTLAATTPAMPTYGANTVPFVPVANPHALYDGVYTNLEHQLRTLAVALE